LEGTLQAVGSVAAIRFDRFSLDLRRGCLRQGGCAIGLRPKSFEVLHYLVENAGRLVPKEELMRAIWRDVIVSDESLARCISDVRRALSDTDQQIIKTVPRRGYLFVASVFDSPPSRSSPDAEVPPGTSQQASGQPSIKEITAALSTIRWLLVIARNSRFTYKGRPIDVRQVGRELGVRYVLEGSVRKEDRQVRISVQLIDAISGSHLWADTFNGSMKQVFGLQDCVASCVAGKIEPQLRRTEIVQTLRKQPDDLDVYDLYLRALGEFHKHTQDGLRAALVHLEQLLAIDPSYVPAAALICECRMDLKLNAWHAVSDAEIADGIRLARYVVQHGKDDPEALPIAAIFLSIYAHDHAVAADAVERALCLSPLDPMRGYFRAGLALANLIAGRYEEALAWAMRSWHELPEYAAAVQTSVIACSLLDRSREAREWLAKSLQLRPGPTIETWKSSVANYTPAMMEVFEQGLRAAGLPSR
jgi:TolB-like protein